MKNNAASGGNVNLANDPKPIVAHIDHAAVAEILKKKEGLAEVLTAVGQWKP